jgi:hypothetical protein
MDHKKLVKDPAFAAMYPNMDGFEVRFGYATAEEAGRVG